MSPLAPLARGLVAGLGLSAVFLGADTRPAPCTALDCPPCGPNYCIDVEAARAEKARKKADAIRRGLPERLAKMFDDLPDCVGCVRISPDWPHIVVELDPEGWERSEGRPPPYTWHSQPWTRAEEQWARDMMRKGLVKSFRITLARFPCRCCPPVAEDRADWTPVSERYWSEQPGWNERLNLHEDAVVEGHTSPDDLGPDPADLTNITEADRRPPVDLAICGQAAVPPAREVHVSCEACRPFKEEHDRYSRWIHDARVRINSYRRSICILNQVIAGIWRESQAVDALADTPGTAAQQDALMEELATRHEAIETDEGKIRELETSIAEMEASRQAALAKLAECEATQCRQAVVSPDDVAIVTDGPVDPGPAADDCTSAGCDDDFGICIGPGCDDTPTDDCTGAGCDPIQSECTGPSCPDEPAVTDLAEECPGCNECTGPSCPDAPAVTGPGAGCAGCDECTGSSCEGAPDGGDMLARVNAIAAEWSLTHGGEDPIGMLRAVREGISADEYFYLSAILDDRIAAARPEDPTGGPPPPIDDAQRARMLAGSFGVANLADDTPAAVDAPADAPADVPADPAAAPANGNAADTWTRLTSIPGFIVAGDAGTPTHVALGGDGGIPVDAGAGISAGLFDAAAATGSFVLRGGRGFGPSRFWVAVVPGVPAGGFKIAENESPLPQNRFFFQYDYFQSARTACPGLGTDVRVLGFEKTFLDGAASAELRLPFQAAPLSDEECGNISVLLKSMLDDGAAGVTLPRFGDLDWGASLGGPIIKDKTHFFLGYVPEQREDVTEAFAEIRLPLLRDTPFFHRLEFLTAYPTQPLVQDFGIEFQTVVPGSAQTPDPPGGGSFLDEEPWIHVESLGGSTGEVMRLTVVNPGPEALVLDGFAALEPVALTPAQAADVAARVRSAPGARATVNASAYCLDIAKQAPPAGVVFRLGDAAKQRALAPLAEVLDAAERVRDAGLLTPDTDPAGYFHSIRQWALWTVRERFDRDAFVDAFVEHTKKNFAERGGVWTDAVEATVRGSAGTRWEAIQAVLAEASP